MRADNAFNVLVADRARHDPARRAVAPLHVASRRLGYIYAQIDADSLNETGGLHSILMLAIAEGNLDKAQRYSQDIVAASRQIALFSEKFLFSARTPFKDVMEG